jgi:hypothetical protein
VSARFGRNQRRKMREAHDRELGLQAMLLRQAQASLASESQGRLKEKHARARLEIAMSEWARRIVSLLGPDSAFARELIEKGVPPGLFASVVEQGHPMRVKPPQPLLAIPDEPIPVNMAMKVIELFSIHAKAENDEISYRRRFLIRGPDGARALVMDARTIHQLTRNGDSELAHFLITELIVPFMAGKVAA